MSMNHMIKNEARRAVRSWVWGGLAVLVAAGGLWPVEVRAATSGEPSAGPSSAPLRQLTPGQPAPPPVPILNGPPLPGPTRTLRVVGRFAYQLTNANEYSGVDSIYVEVRDDDTIGHSVIWSGFTDNDGAFDSGVVDISDDDNEPDLYVYFETDTPIVSVNGGGYSWSSENNIVVDFTGNYYDFGTQTPADSGVSSNVPALAAHQVITRAWQFVLTATGIQIPKVEVLWPSGDEFGYDYDGDIILGEYYYLESNLLHQYAHHLESAVGMGVEAEGVCSDFCQYCEPYSSCGPGDPLGKCRWCPTTPAIARSEGFADWFPSAANRFFETYYLTDSGTPFGIFVLNNVEFFPPEVYPDDPFNEVADLAEIRAYCGADVLDNAERITNAVSAFLEDVADAEFDDHARNGTNDCAALGDDAVLLTYLADRPTDVLELITDLILRYPDKLPGLYASAKNLSPVYLAPFPVDTEAPGAIPPGAYESPSHDALGASNTWPCLHVRWETPDDDVSGGCAYSIEWSQTPDVVPDMTAELVGTCPLVVGPALPPGQWYVCVRVQDCAGHWSDETSCLGPFEIADCNNNGIPDACDVYWLETDPPRPDPDPFAVMGCSLPPGFCAAYPPPTEPDCNRNFVPDSCDVAYGASDCNLDGFPDECESIDRWADGNGDWAVDANWDRSFVPTESEFVCIGPVPEELTLTVSTGVQSVGNYACHENLSVIGGTLQSAWDSYVFGDLLLGGTGVIAHDGTLSVYGLLTWQHSGQLKSATSTAATTLVRGGAVIGNGSVMLGPKHVFDLAAGDVLATGAVALQSNALVRVQAGTTYEFQGDGSVFTGSTATFQNEGSFIRSSGDGSANLGSPIDNRGLIRNQAGQLLISAGGVTSGNLVSDAGTLLRLGGSHDLTTGSALTAADLDLLASNSGTIRGGVNVRGLLRIDNGGIWTFTNESTVTTYGQDLFVRQGTVHFESPSAAAVDFDSVTVGAGQPYGGVPHFDTGETLVVNSLHMVYGSWYGSDPITINEAFTWTGGNIFAGGTITCLGPVTILASSSNRSLSRILNNTAQATFLGGISPSGAGRFVNTATGTIDLQGDNTGLTGGRSTNDGTITKTAGTGRSTLAGMTNNGLIHAETGELYFYFNGENNGDILGDPGTLLTFNGTIPMNAGSSLTGDDVKFTGNTFNINGAVDIAGTLTLDGGVCTFTSDAEVVRYGQQVDALTGNLHFESPVPETTLDFNSVQIGGGSYGAGVYFDTGQPVNIGTLTMINGNVNGQDPITITDTFTWGGVGSFLYGGKVTCLGSAIVQLSSSQRNCYRDFDNAGTVTLLGAFDLGGSADFTNLPGGSVDLQSDNAKFGLNPNSVLVNYGRMIKSGGSGVSQIYAHFRNAGELEIQNGDIQFSGSYALTCIQTAGATILNGGGIELVTGARYQLQGGDLTGVGTVTGVVENSGGTVRPGLSPGALSIDGEYTQQAGGTLEIELGGLNPDAEFDRLQVTGTAALHGMLRVIPFGGFVPQVGQQFTIINAGAITGTFDQITGPGDYDVAYTATTVTLTVTAAPCSSFAPADFDHDCDVDLDDLAMLAACQLGAEVRYDPLNLPAGCTFTPIADRIAPDFDQDGDVDLADFGVFQRCYSGSDQPSDPDCAE